MSKLAKIVSWTGWSKDDWKDIFFKPISWTGWSKSDWKEFFVEGSKCLGTCSFGIAALYLLFCSGLAV